VAAVIPTLILITRHAATTSIVTLPASITDSDLFRRMSTHSESLTCMATSPDTTEIETIELVEF
jgi:hypothetical protein